MSEEAKWNFLKACGIKHVVKETLREIVGVKRIDNPGTVVSLQGLVSILIIGVWLFVMAGEAWFPAIKCPAMLSNSANFAVGWIFKGGYNKASMKARAR